MTQLRHRLPTTGCCCWSAALEHSEWASQATTEINRSLAARYGSSGEVTYLDIGSLFIKDGKLNRELFFDPKLTPPASPVHPTAEGQALMAAAIEPTLAALLGDRPRIAEAASTRR